MKTIEKLFSTFPTRWNIEMPNDLKIVMIVLNFHTKNYTY